MVAKRKGEEAMAEQTRPPRKEEIKRWDTIMVGLTWTALLERRKKDGREIGNGVAKSF